MLGKHEELVDDWLGGLLGFVAILIVVGVIVATTIRR